MTKKVFSGIQPSGDIHIGNYIGAIDRWVRSQDDYDNIFCIVDLHAITVPQDPQSLKQNINNAAALLIACGIDPQKSAIFVQSHITAHAELTWILNCLTPMGWLERMTQFKDKAQNKERVSVGLFDYPVLMAADILLYQTNLVPVGQDQKQHVELARNIAKRFNSQYGDTFTIPEPMIATNTARIMSLTDPTKKMSKSDTQPNSAIKILDKPDDIAKKIQNATTDSQKNIVFDKKRAGVFNLLNIYQALTQQSPQEIENNFKGKGYAEFKKELAQVIIEALQPIQNKYSEIIANSKELDNILSQGANKIREIANHTLQNVKNKIGLS